jgi:hypothetical protein
VDEQEAHVIPFLLWWQFQREEGMFPVGQVKEENNLLWCKDCIVGLCFEDWFKIYHTIWLHESSDNF